MKTLAEQTRTFVHCRILRPLLRLIKRGVPPRELAWSLAIAVVVGINPFLGMTTITMLLLAWMFKLNHVATQIGIHTVAPLQWILFIPFMRAGTLIFHTGRLPMSKAAILHMSQNHPLRLVRILWQWEWHALVVWAVVAALLAPVIAAQFRKMLVLSLRRHKALLV